MWERSQQCLEVPMLMDLLLIKLVKSSSESPVQSGYLLFCRLFLPCSVSEMLHIGRVLAECWILNCGPVHLHILLNLSWNGFVILEMKHRHSEGDGNIRAALAVWELQWLLLCGLMRCLFFGMPVLFLHGMFPCAWSTALPTERFCTSQSLLTTCLLYLGPRGCFALLKESWLYTLLGNMPRKHKLEEIIAGWI